MTRHARNCTAGAVYTYHEKKKDAQASGYGTNAQRLGKDSIKDFDCCCLSLQPCRNPIITKEGFLFDKQVILEYIIAKKNENSRKLKEYERLKKEDKESDLNRLTAETDKKVSQFLKGENTIVSKRIDGFKSEPATSSISNVANGKEKELPSFWVPCRTPQAQKAPLEKPDNTIYCPMSGKPLKVKDLIDIKLTPIGDSKGSLITKDVRYKCPITHDALSNSVPCAVLKPTGDVVTLECVEKIIKKDWIHPLTGKKLVEKDIIVLQRGGTGYSQTNTELNAKVARPALQA